ncbi:conjugal transfer protein [Blautia producta]|uniref:conjugal transfer protein n=1 Tax=Blautia producta TaxID=33035 RepID=UPI0039843BB6
MFKKNRGKVRQSEAEERREEDLSEYKLKNVAGWKAARIILWSILIFLIVRGAAAILIPDKNTQTAQKVEKLQKAMDAEMEQRTRILSFASDFAKEYMTYDKDGGEEFKKRLSKYMTEDLSEAADIYDFQTEAKATYADAYRMEQIKDNRTQVYVHVEVAGTVYETVEDTEEKKEEKKDSKDKSKDKTKETVKETAESADIVYTLKVPVQVTKTGFVVDGFPLLVSDKDSYYVQDYEKRSIPSKYSEYKDVDKVEETINNFLTAYYTDKQSVIDYFLHETADKTNFSGLSGENDLALLEIAEIKAYTDTDGNILSVVRYKVQDKRTKTVVMQSSSFTLVEEKGQLYIMSMEPATYSK